MDFGLSDERKQLQEEVRRFAENEVGPNTREYDVEEKFPHEIIDAAAEMGLRGATIPMEYSGAGYVNDFDVERLYRDVKSPRSTRGPPRSKRTSSPANSSAKGF